MTQPKPGALRPGGKSSFARLPDWRARLSAYLFDVARLPFRPGAHDCALFAAGAVQAMTGHDLAAEWRGTYRTLEDGLAALQAAGHADHIALAGTHFKRVARARAQVGDLAVMPADLAGDPGALGVIQGAGVYVLRPSGLAVANRLKIKKAFRV